MANIFAHLSNCTKLRNALIIYLPIDVSDHNQTKRIVSSAGLSRRLVHYSLLSNLADSFGKTWYRLENPDKHQ